MQLMTLLALVVIAGAGQVTSAKRLKLTDGAELESRDEGVPILYRDKGWRMDLSALQIH